MLVNYGVYGCNDCPENAAKDSTKVHYLWPKNEFGFKTHCLRPF